MNEKGSRNHNQNNDNEDDSDSSNDRNMNPITNVNRGGGISNPGVNNQNPKVIRSLASVDIVIDHSHHAEDMLTLDVRRDESDGGEESGENINLGRNSFASCEQFVKQLSTFKHSSNFLNAVYDDKTGTGTTRDYKEERESKGAEKRSFQDTTNISLQNDNNNNNNNNKNTLNNSFPRGSIELTDMMRKAEEKKDSKKGKGHRRGEDRENKGKKEGKENHHSFGSGSSFLAPRDLIRAVRKEKKTPSNPRNFPNSKEEDYNERPYRIVEITNKNGGGGEGQEFWFCSNEIVTSQYTGLNFLPLFLWQSFNPQKKLANVYFLILSILQCIPAITNTGGYPTLLVPLFTVIFFDGVFAILEDLRRHKADKTANGSSTHVFDYQEGKFVPTIWKDLKVGDVVKIRNREVIPADLCLLATHETDEKSPDGICYLNTKSLDGETNLKLRETLDCTLTRLKRDSDVLDLQATIMMEHPNKLVDSFMGTFELSNTNIQHLASSFQFTKSEDYDGDLGGSIGFDMKKLKTHEAQRILKSEYQDEGSEGKDNDIPLGYDTMDLSLGSTNNTEGTIESVENVQQNLVKGVDGKNSVGHKNSSSDSFTLSDQQDSPKTNKTKTHQKNSSSTTSSIHSKNNKKFDGKSNDGINVDLISPIKVVISPKRKGISQEKVEEREKEMEEESNLGISGSPASSRHEKRKSSTSSCSVTHSERSFTTTGGSGVIEVTPDNIKEVIQPVNVLLRGCTIRNTEWIIGVIINTGNDTKIMMSNVDPPFKISRMGRVTNRQIKFIVILLLVICAVGATGYLTWGKLHANLTEWYLYENMNGWSIIQQIGHWILKFFYYFLLFGNFVPVSLYVSLSTVKFLQATFMNLDLQMYHEASDTPCLVRTMSLNEELGQVSHIFTDKTGTLTCNIMEFRKCSIGGKSYGKGLTEIAKSIRRLNNRSLTQEEIEIENKSKENANIGDHVNFYDPALDKDMEAYGKTSHESIQREKIQEFFLHLAICHTVIPEKYYATPTNTSQMNSSLNSSPNTTGQGQHIESESCRKETFIKNDPTSDRQPLQSFDSYSTQDHDLACLQNIDVEEIENGTNETIIVSSPSNNVKEGGGKGASKNKNDENNLDTKRKQQQRQQQQQGLDKSSSYDPFASQSNDNDHPFDEDNNYNNEEVKFTIKYSASSPDDEALVCTARYFGFEFIERIDSKVYVKVSKGTVEEQGIKEFQVLEILEFTSDRKRMSIITLTPQNTVKIFTKGADGVIIPRLRRGQDKIIEETSAQMKTYALEGLRTLCIVYSEMTLEEYDKWAAKWDVVSRDVKEIEIRREGKENNIDKLMDEIENNYILLGCTAIEDKLQERVPETIYDLTRAGIRIWMLTGDKEETAVNIGVACNLIENPKKMHRILLTSTLYSKDQEIENKLRDEIKKYKGDRTADTMEGNGPKSLKPRGLVVDGQTLNKIFKSSKLKKKFIKLTEICKCVVACRVSPDQKRVIVELVKVNQPSATTLSIGDGANDVPMIQEAHIGVGIAGQEGMQAANSSDYSIGQFRFLQNLTLVHGRYNYHRLAFIISYIFYKNSLMNICQFVFAFNNGFSGQKYFSEAAIQMFNVVFSTFPLVLYGVWDRDVKYESALKFPQLYINGLRHHNFNSQVFWSWVVLGAVEASVVTFFPLHGLTWLNDSYQNQPGPVASFWEAGACTFTLLIFLVNIKLAMRQNKWNSIMTIVWVITVGCWFAAGSVVNVVWSLDSNYYWLLFVSWSSSSFWLMVCGCLALLVFPDLYQLGVRRCFYPDLVQIVQAYERNWISEATVKTTFDHLLNIDAPPISGTRDSPSTSISSSLSSLGSSTKTPGLGTTPIEASLQLLDFAHKTSGYAFSVDPITVEAEKRRLKCGSARLAPLLQIIELEEEQDESDSLGDSGGSFTYKLTSGVRGGRQGSLRSLGNLSSRNLLQELSSESLAKKLDRMIGKEGEEEEEEGEGQSSTTSTTNRNRKNSEDEQNKNYNQNILSGPVPLESIYSLSSLRTPADGNGNKSDFSLSVAGYDEDSSSSSLGRHTPSVSIVSLADEEEQEQEQQHRQQQSDDDDEDEDDDDEEDEVSTTSSILSEHIRLAKENEARRRESVAFYSPEKDKEKEEKEKEKEKGKEN